MTPQSIRDSLLPSSSSLSSSCPLPQRPMIVAVVATAAAAFDGGDLGVLAL